MATVLEPVTMTAEEFLALPDNGVSRWLLNGVVQEEGMTVRSWWHSEAMVRISAALMQWLESQPTPRGKLLGGEVGFRMFPDSDTIVGIDVAYIASELARNLELSSRIIRGVPVLAVEILSSSETHANVHNKIASYLSAGVNLVWIIDVELRTITVLEQGKSPIMFNREQTITAEPYLPDFSASVEKLLAV